MNKIKPSLSGVNKIKLSLSSVNKIKLSLSSVNKVRPSLTSKLLIGFVLLFFFTVALAYWVLFLPNIRVLQEQAENSVEAVSVQVAVQIDRVLQQMVTVSNIIHVNRNYRRLLVLDDMDYIAQIRNYWILSEELRVINSYFYNLSLDIYLYDESILTHEQVFFRGIWEIDDVSWLDDVVLNKGGIIWTTVPGSNPDVPTISAIRLMDNNILKVSVPQSEVMQIFELAVKYIPISLFITDQHNQVLFAFADEFMPDDSASNRFIYNPLAANGWQLVTVAPMDYFDAEIRHAQLLFFTVILVLLMLFLAVTFIISRSIRHRVRNIDQVLSQVESQNFEEKILIHQQDELSQIETRINVFIERIQALMQDLIATESMKKQLELQALQAQIKPHFIYNALDAVSWMALDIGNEPISDALINLATLLRKNFTLDEDMVTIKDEMEHATLYVEAMKYRSDCVIELLFDIEESMQHNRAIKFTFQPIIENAILHGFMKEGRPSGTIVIKGRMQGGSNVIHIHDDGVGFAQPDKNTKGFGLKSVSERLKLYSGEDSSMTIKSTVGVGTDVQLIWK